VVLLVGGGLLFPLGRLGLGLCLGLGLTGELGEDFCVWAGFAGAWARRPRVRIPVATANTIFFMGLNLLSDSPL